MRHNSHRPLTWHLWAVQELRKFHGHDTEVSAVAWHPVHEDLFISGDKNGALKFWLESCEEAQDAIDNAHDGQVFSIDWHPLGHMVVSGSNDQTAKFWTRQHPGDEETTRYAGPVNRHQFLGTSGIGHNTQNSDAPQVNRPAGSQICLLYTSPSPRDS